MSLRVTNLWRSVLLDCMFLLASVDDHVVVYHFIVAVYISIYHYFCFRLLLSK